MTIVAHILKVMPDRHHSVSKLRIIHMQVIRLVISMVYKYIDIVGTSTKGTDDAIRNAIEESSKTVKDIKWAEVGRVTVLVKKEVLEYQAEVKIGFEVRRSIEE